MQLVVGTINDGAHASAIVHANAALTRAWPSRSDFAVLSTNQGLHVVQLPLALLPQDAVKGARCCPIDSLLPPCPSLPLLHHHKQPVLLVLPGAGQEV